jgi:iron complex outermembrane receptor protein
VEGNDPRVRSPPSNFLDASLTADFSVIGSKAHVTLYGKNLADDRVPTDAFTVAGLFSFGYASEPRSGGITVGFEF